jgi:hypothetical protein
VRADWSWSTHNTSLFNPTTNFIASDNINGGGIYLTSPGDTSMGGSPIHQAGPSDIVLSNLSTVANTVTGQFGTNSGYNIHFTLSDSNAAGHSLSWDIQGKFGGTYDNLSANFTHTFTTSPLFQEFNFTAWGGADYLVTLYDPITKPGIPGSPGLGAISAHVDILDGSSIKQVPEPSTVMLSFLGLSFAGAAGWQRRRRLRIPLMPATY